MNPTTRRRFCASAVFAAVAITALLSAGARGVEAAPRSPSVNVIELRGVIDPTSASYLLSRLEDAQAGDAEAVVIQMDTPGALDVSMGSLIQAIVESDVPVITWVAPGGARAASAGTFLAYAGDLTFMSTTARMGPPLPVDLGAPASPAARADAEALLARLAREGGDPIGSMPAATSIGAAEAVDGGVADGIASSLRELLEAMDGVRVTVGDGSSVALETWDEATGSPSATVRFTEMNPFQRLLHFVSDGEIAYLLLLLGAFGLIFELYNPGIGLAAILGALALLGSFYALFILPTSWAAVAVITGGIVLLVVDLHRAGLGLFSAGGLIAVVIGGLLLFSGAPDELAVSPWTIVLAVALTLVFFISVMTAALRVRLRRPIGGEDELVGTVGEAQTDIAPEGTVVTKGTVWRARTMETGIAAGSKVQVKATEGLVLLVEPLEE